MFNQLGGFPFSRTDRNRLPEGIYSVSLRGQLEYNSTQRIIETHKLTLFGSFVERTMLNFIVCRSIYPRYDWCMYACNARILRG